METIEVPFNIAIKAARHFRPLMPYVNKARAKMHQEKELINQEPEPVIEQRPKRKTKGA